MELYYKSSEGVVINLIGNEYKMLSETDLFNTEWQYETVGSNYPYISAFKNQMVSRSCTVVVSGATNDDLKDNLEHLIEVLDRDVRLGQVGAIYYGNYYRECYCTATEKPKIEGRTKVNIGLTFVAEDGDWKSTQNQSYSGVSGGKWLNKYAVPSVSSNETNYQYGMIEDSEGSITFASNYDTAIDVSYYMTFTIESTTANISYSLDGGTSVTVTSSDCPLDIDVSSGSQIVITPTTFSTMAYSLTVEPNASYISWSSAPYDDERTFTLDLGAVTSIESITGIGIGKGYTVMGADSVYLETSSDGITWTSRASVSLPTDDTIADLEYTPSSPVDIRYIRIVSSLYPYSITSRTFKIEAHFTGEEQNLATSVVVSPAPNQTYEINDGIVSLYRYFNGVMSGDDDVMTLTLPNETTVVAINNLTLTNLRSGYNTFYIEDANGNTIDSVVLSANDTQSYSWSGEVETSQIRLFFVSKYGEISSSNFEILEEQTEAPHRYILNENYVPSDAIIKIYGATTSPSIMIGDNQYGAENITLDDGEFLEINTKDETIKHYVDSDGWVNVFNHRLDDSFEKIEVGSSEITWEGNLTVDIELLNSRSDPKWN